MKKRGMGDITDPKGFFEKVTELLLDHGPGAPIYTVHLIKTARAVQEEFSKTSDSCSFYLLAGLNRFLHSPIKQWTSQSVTNLESKLRITYLRYCRALRRLNFLVNGGYIMPIALRKVSSFHGELQ